MAGDRDLAVAFVRAWAPSASPPLRGWEMTSATGVRGLRLLHETGAFREFVFSELHPAAAEVLRLNAARFPGSLVLEGDCRSVPAGAPFDFVDLDPYGSPVPFAKVALASVRLGGVVAVTATDMMVLGGAQPKACEAHYGARPVRGRLGPEGGLRILIGYLARAARSMDRSFRPLLSYCRDHYVRVYAEVGAPSAGPLPLGTIDPRTWDGPPLGDRGPFGPLWLGPLFDRPLVSRMSRPEGAARPQEVASFLARLADEVTVDRPFYYESNTLSARLGLAAPPGLPAIRAELTAVGYRVARTHARPEGFRTDAPRAVVEERLAHLASGG